MIVRYIQATKSSVDLPVNSAETTGSDKKLMVVDITCSQALMPNATTLYPLYHLASGGKILAIQSIQMFVLNATLFNSKVQFYIEQGHTIKIGLDETATTLPVDTRFVLSLIIGV